MADHLLVGLKGVEIGGSAHNDFELDTINVDYTDEVTVYKLQEKELCGKMMRVDIVADASRLPFKDKSFDFVINSHVLEHLWDPIGAIIEWKRVARKYIYIIVPNKEQTFDINKPLTPIADLYKRNIGELKKPEGSPSDDHWTIWNPASFRVFCESVSLSLDLDIKAFQPHDDKVGNGIAVCFSVE
jgi:SAM-dependent methyltransferase